MRKRAVITLTVDLSAKEARLLALYACGLDSRQDKSVLDVITRFGMLQIDSVNVFERAHYMPLFSRLGSFDKDELDSLTGGKNPTLIEYWAHQASFIKATDLPLFDWRIQWYRERASQKDSFENQNKKLITWIKAELRANGPMTSSQFEHEENTRRGSWWGWSNVKRSLERMIFQGELIAAGRTNFSRIYALPEQVLSSKILNKSIPHEKAKQLLLSNASRLMGVGTVRDIANVYCQTTTEIKSTIRDLLEAGVIHEVNVAGWKERAYIHNDFLDLNFKAVKPNLTTVLSPFDPLTWQRERALRIFDFDYRIEIYTPEPKRIYGYYSLPTLHKDKLVARIDLKSDRQNKALLVQSAWHELQLTETQVSQYSKPIAKHLEQVRKWQRLESVEIKPKGNLALELAANRI
ncbi:MAG: winged helix-turn-helix domain-containing protein [Micrococcales bacterium]|nr:winged helix-turn-helix domain-containing protein [Actinomycetota bacterium]NCA07884.1 winged helix-turn-helix domain-containing protein [Micrococcales bacterium]